MLVIDREVPIRTIPLPPHLEVIHNRIESALSPAVKTWIDKQVRLYFESGLMLSWGQNRFREEVHRKFSASARALGVRISLIEAGLLFAWLSRYFDKLDSSGDDAQLANVDLQNKLQKQQQTLQMLSTISKELGDTEMAVIRKIGG